MGKRGSTPSPTLKCATRVAHFVVWLAAGALVSGFTAAAVPVEESVADGEPAYQPAIRVPTAQPPVQQPVPAVIAETTVESTGGNQRLRELFYQLQVLQQEVQELRGLVEEQNYQLSRLARDQQEQYIDLDRRVAQLAQASAGAGPPGLANTGALPGQGMPPSTPVNAGTGGTFPRTPIATTILATGGGEREAYTGAFDLMKDRQFDESAMAFNQLIVAYPNGQYTPNAFYWLGELYLASEDVEKARQSFAQVLNLYPDHPKIADTLYKLGVVYHRLGDGRRSVEYFNRVQTEYPQSSAANLAASYAAEIR